MMRPICIFARIFEGQGEADRQRSERVLELWLRALTATNQLWLEQHPNTPSIYDGGVRYRREPKRQRERFEAWLDLPTVLQRGYGDCEDLGAARAAELRVDGIDAQPFLIGWPVRKDGRTLWSYHVQVEWPNGTIEDPSVALGMRPIA